jgi:hypothetical protein
MLRAEKDGSTPQTYENSIMKATKYGLIKGERGRVRMGTKRGLSLLMAHYLTICMYGIITMKHPYICNM